MLTECPSCLTVFRVTGAILKVGHGQVRCGKCRTQFDALESLLDEEDPEEDETEESAPASAVPPRQRVEPSIDVRAPESAEEITLEGSRIEISGTYRVPAASNASDSVEQVIHEHFVIDRDAESDRNTAGSDEPGLDDPDAEEAAFNDLDEIEVFDVSDDDEPLDEATRDLLDENEPAPEAVAANDEPRFAPLSQRLVRRSQAAAAQQVAHRDIEAELHALTRPERQTRHRGLWLALAATMVVTLAAQYIHHHRDELIRSPKWGDTVARLYRSLGLALPPNWDLKAYELQVWDVTLGNERDTLRVRASVTNTAAFAQPYPLIKLALEDRWGSVVAMRAFKPEEYLPASAPTDRLMAPRQRANAEIAVIDPGADAVGFKSYPCLPTPEGATVLCRDDLPFVR